MRLFSFLSLLSLLVAVGCDTTTTKQDINKATGTDTTTTDVDTDRTTTTTSKTTVTTETDDDGPPKPDNTAVNERDADGDTKTPIDQGQDQASVDRSAEIRRRVLDLPDLSVNARNVKIITEKDGKVTLRGPVENQSEHDAIVKIAKDVAGATNVDDHIEVKADEDK